jgi:cystathionine beta-lyase
MTSHFDRILDRRRSESIKWNQYPADVLPMWVADMDFSSPPAVIEALKARAEHGVFGYAITPPELKEVIVARLFEKYRWRVGPEDLVFLPGVISGFNLAARALAEPGAGLLIQPPVYMPFLDVAENNGMIQQEARLYQRSDGRYEIDLDAYRAAVDEHTRMFLLCNPHNPVGRVYTPAELSGMAEICLRSRVVICSDEIHCDLVFSGQQHTPLATLDSEIAANTITLMAPSKTFNIPGLKCAFAIIQNPDLRKRFQKARRGLVGDVNLMGYQAALAAYKYGEEWLAELLVYLEANRDYLYDTIQRNFSGVSMVKPEGTYLAWLDCRAAAIGQDPCGFFLEKARVGLNDGARFGSGGEGFVRLNFGCPRSVLEEGLSRMQTALEQANKV